MLMTELTPTAARRLKAQLLNAPVAPGGYSHLINVGTDSMLDVLEEHYFRRELADGISCFKYLEGDYGTGKTQFIQSLAQRAHRNNIVTAIVSVGQECPFSSPSAILRNIMRAFAPPPENDTPAEGKGIEVLFDRWIARRLAELGVPDGAEVPAVVKREVERHFDSVWLGAPDLQMAAALAHLGRRLLALRAGATPSALDNELIAWIRGDSIASRNLRDLGIYEKTRDETAFSRLKTVVGFLRARLGHRGFFVAFDEGTRTSSFRRGSIRQRQAIENMLSMINENAEGAFGGVMFLYAATPDFRADVINNYIALRDRIGRIAFQPGRPMVPLIDLGAQNTDAVLHQLSERLMDVFERADDVRWDRALQRSNVTDLIEAQKQEIGYVETVPPRFLVYHLCRLLESQRPSQFRVDLNQAVKFVRSTPLSEESE
jgi:hypothetical protein